MNLGSCHPAESLTAPETKPTSSLRSSLSTAVSFSWHDSYSHVPTDSFRSGAFLFFCEPPALLMELRSPKRNPLVNTDPELAKTPGFTFQPFPATAVSETHSPFAFAFLLSTVHTLISALASCSSFSTSEILRSKKHHVPENARLNFFRSPDPQLVLSLHGLLKSASLFLHVLDGILQFFEIPVLICLQGFVEASLHVILH